MVEHKCNSCFYMQHERNKHPCNVCEGYNKYVNRNIYIHQPAAKGEDYFVPDTITIKEWDEEDYFDEWDKEQYMKQTDNVNSPKHYMLFEDKGIEVRHVIEKLVAKIYAQPKGSPSPLFTSDYAQMMQYFMRFMEKNGKEDLEKGLWFLHRVLEAYE